MNAVRMRRFWAILLISAAAFLPSGNAAGMEPGSRKGFLDVFTFGIEWSYISTPVAYRHFNYVSVYGYRVDRKNWRAHYHANGEILLHAGCNVLPRLNLSLYGGYSGIYRLERLYPLSLRATCHFGSAPDGGRWFAYADAGAGFSGAGQGKTISGICKAGCGYRIPLSRHTSLDFSAAVRGVKTRIGVADLTGNGTTIYIPEDNLRCNEALYLGIMVGIGLSF